MEVKRKWTFVNVKFETREKLRHLKKAGEDYDKLINRLIELAGVEGKTAPSSPPSAPASTEEG